VSLESWLGGGTCAGDGSPRAVVVRGSARSCGGDGTRAANLVMDG
jgi:hypothetical protein